MTRESARSTVKPQTETAWIELPWDPGLAKAPVVIDNNPFSIAREVDFVEGGKGVYLDLTLDAKGVRRQEDRFLTDPHKILDEVERMKRAALILVVRWDERAKAVPQPVASPLPGTEILEDVGVFALRTALLIERNWPFIKQMLRLAQRPETSDKVVELVKEALVKKALKYQPNDPFRREIVETQAKLATEWSKIKRLPPPPR